MYPYNSASDAPSLGAFLDDVVARSLESCSHTLVSDISPIHMLVGVGWRIPTATGPGPACCMVAP